MVSQWTKLREYAFRMTLYVALGTQLSACYVWRGVPAERPVPADEHVMVRVLRADSTWVVLQDARVEGNHLIGDEVYPGNLYDKEIELDAILRADAYRLDSKRTAGLIAGLGAGTAVAIGIASTIWELDWQSPFEPCC
jgi:hypothetical protein